MTDITRLIVATPEATQDIAALVAQLSSDAPAPSQADLAAILASPTNDMLIAQSEGVIIGMTTLVTIRTATGSRCFIDDVVVLDSHRGQGLGEALIQAAIRLARDHGAKKIDLTSRPSREAANRLYRRLGFVLRDTNAYRLVLTT
ncbi:GNAT family N-acetyltransferase [Lacibacterium aquatile]|uniref:GNAT family N-acetyltransferase n=1 Tax=Lacibacterium aquatile TaxID=1168082 RepID=A0ABW5DUR0_9PROT